METIIRLRQLLQVTGLSRSVIYERMKEDDFPRPIPLGKKARGWLASEVLAWQAARIALRDGSRGEVINFKTGD